MNEQKGVVAKGGQGEIVEALKGRRETLSVVSALVVWAYEARKKLSSFI